ncbi:hypothetical protein B0H13DRAFT_2342462 [Mycena leptocephala]|nr:hypothetical protein B0H13DRAFT_2342462 [Mycena leptocephala]
MPNTPPFILSLDLCTPSLRPSNGLPPFVPERPRLHRLPLAYAFLIRSISYILVYSASPRPSCAAMLTTVSRLHPHTLILIRCLPFLSFPLSSSLPIRVHASSQSLPQNPTIDAAVTGSAAGYVQLTTERERRADSFPRRWCGAAVLFLPAGCGCTGRGEGKIWALRSGRWRWRKARCGTDGA